MAAYGGHLGYWDGPILAILNLYVTPMPPIKFRLNLTYGHHGHGGHLGYWNRRNLAILNLCHPDASHHVSAQFDLKFGT